MSEYPQEAWQRLGRLLKSRRVHIDPEYRNRGAFCASTGLNYKLVQEIEGATRTTFGDATFALLETSYRLTEGSIRRALAGGDLEPSDRGVVTLSVAAEAKAPAAEPGDELDLESFVPTTDLEKALIAIYRANQRAIENLTKKVDRLSIVQNQADDQHDQQQKGA